MGLIRIATMQGHPVPKVVGSSGTPWDSRLFTYPGRLPEEMQRVEEFPAGATVQNNMEGVDVYQCNYCGDILLEDQLASHSCELAETESEE